MVVSWSSRSRTVPARVGDHVPVPRLQLVYAIIPSLTSVHSGSPSKRRRTVAVGQSPAAGQNRAALAAVTTPTPAQQEQHPPQHSYQTPPFTDGAGGISTRSHASSGNSSGPFHSPVPTATAAGPSIPSISAVPAGAACTTPSSVLPDDDIQSLYINNAEEMLNCAHASMLASQRAAEHFAIDMATQRLQDLAEESEDLFSEKDNPADNAADDADMITANADSDARMTSVSPASHDCRAYDDQSDGSVSLQLPSPLHSQARFASPGAVRSPRATYLAPQVTPRTARCTRSTRSGASVNGTSGRSSGSGKSGDGSRAGIDGRSGPSPSPFPTQRWNPNRGVSKLADCTTVDQQMDVLAVVLQIDPACHVATRNGAAGLLNFSIGDPSCQHFQISIWGQRAISVRLNPGDVVRITKISVKAFQGRFIGSLLRNGTIHLLTLADMRTKLPTSCHSICKDCATVPRPARDHLDRASRATAHRLLGPNGNYRATTFRSPASQSVSVAVPVTLSREISHALRLPRGTPAQAVFADEIVVAF